MLFMRSMLYQGLAPPDTSLCYQVLHDVTRDSAAGLDATGAEAGNGVPSAADPAAMLPHLLELQRQTALMVNELLRHFWGCFPVSSKPRLDKLRRLHKGLSEQYDKCASPLPNPCDEHPQPQLVGSGDVRRGALKGLAGR